MHSVFLVKSGVTVYLRDKAERLRRTWEDADSLRVD
jgi:hypothetical protein